MELTLNQITSEPTHYKIHRTTVTPNGLMSARPYERFKPTLFGLVESNHERALCMRDQDLSVIAENVFRHMREEIDRAHRINYLFMLKISRVHMKIDLTGG